MGIVNVVGVEVPLEVHRPKKPELFLTEDADGDDNEDNSAFGLREGVAAEEATSFRSS